MRGQGTGTINNDDTRMTLTVDACTVIILADNGATKRIKLVANGTAGGTDRLRLQVTTYQVNDTTSIPSGAASQPTTTPSPVSVGSGTDTLVLNMAEDPYQGDAQFTVSVDGKQIGGTQTTTAVVDDPVKKFHVLDMPHMFGRLPITSLV